MSCIESGVRVGAALVGEGTLGRNAMALSDVNSDSVIVPSSKSSLASRMAWTASIVAMCSAEQKPS